MKKYFLIVLFAFVLFSCPTVFADTFTGRATIGRQAFMDTSLNYYYTDYKTLADSSLNILPVPSQLGNNFYSMGTEYSYAINLTGQTDFVVTVRVPVAENTIYTYQLTDGLNQYDFKIGLSPNFSVYNITPNIQVFNHTCGVYSHLGVAHTYCYYDITSSFILDSPLTGAYNLNFAVINSSSNRSSYYFSGGNTGVSAEFPTGYYQGESWDYSVMTPSVSITTGTTSNNQDIIDQSIANTQEIKDSIQESYENLVKSQEVCNSYDYTTNIPVGVANAFLRSDGTMTTNYQWNNVSDYISINKGRTYNLSVGSAGNAASYCLYDSNKVLLSCSAYNGTYIFDVTPSSDGFIRFSYSNSSPILYFKGLICQNGNQALVDSITDSSIDEHSANSFFDGIDFFEDSTLSSVITSPLTFINSLDDGCTPIVLQYRGQSITLPCGDEIFWNRSDVSTFRAFWNALFGGLIIYRLVRRLFIVVEQAMNPEDTNTLGGLDL